MQHSFEDYIFDMNFNQCTHEAYSFANKYNANYSFIRSQTIQYIGDRYTPILVLTHHRFEPFPHCSGRYSIARYDECHSHNPKLSAVSSPQRDSSAG